MKRSNRRRIAEEMIEVNRAHKKAIYDTRNYKLTHGRASFDKKGSKQLPFSKTRERISYFFQKKYYSSRSFLLYLYYTILDLKESLRISNAMIAATFSTFVLLALGLVGMKSFIGYDVLFNGYKIGVVKNLSDLDAAIVNVESNLSEWYKVDTVFFEQTISTTRAFINKNQNPLDAKEAEEALYKCNLTAWADGAVITIDGQETVRLASYAEAKAVTDGMLLNTHYSDDIFEEKIIEFNLEQAVEVIAKRVELSKVMSPPEAVDYLLSLDPSSMPAEQDVAAAGTMPTKSMPIAPERASIQDQGKLINETIAENNESGNRGLMTALDFRKNEYSLGEMSSATVFAAKVSKVVTRHEPIPFQVVTRTDPTMFRGAEKVVIEGVDGVNERRYLVSYLNGKAVMETLQNETVIKEPINAVVNKGSKPLPSAKSSGTFNIPVSGRVSSFTESRSGSHAEFRAIDISCPTGTPVTASDSGVVSRSDYFGDYGYTVIINHANGFSTLYGHNSELKVSVGQKVDQGELIALSGSTGRSTGPHVHFEIRHNNNRLDLRDFFDVTQGQTLKAGLSY